jgi:peptidoglycan hydrolase CwlO-like protein
MQDSIITVLVTAITVLGSASAWRYYENRERRRQEDDNFIKLDCRDRIAKLEAILSKSSEEKEEMRKTILDLTRQVSELATKVAFLERENKELKVELNEKHHED